MNISVGSMNYWLVISITIETIMIRILLIANLILILDRMTFLLQCIVLMG